jgi:hypothetical protein
MRLKCIDDHWKEGLKDPDLTKGQFYNSIDNNLMVLNHEPMFTVFGDNRLQDLNIFFKLCLKCNVLYVFRKILKER